MSYTRMQRESNEKATKEQREYIQSKYIEADNCSIAQIDSNYFVQIFNTKLYPTDGNSIDYSNDSVTFYVKEPEFESLNQSNEARPKTLKVPLLIAFEIMQHFKEINARMLQELNKD